MSFVCEKTGLGTLQMQKKAPSGIYKSGVLALPSCLQELNFKSQLSLMMEVALLQSPAPKHVFVVTWSSRGLPTALPEVSSVWGRAVCSGVAQPCLAFCICETRRKGALRRCFPYLGLWGRKPLSMLPIFQWWCSLAALMNSVSVWMR